MPTVGDVAVIAPRSEVHLVSGDRRPRIEQRTSFAHPVGVIPLVVDGPHP